MNSVKSLQHASSEAVLSALFPSVKVDCFFVLITKKQSKYFDFLLKNIKNSTLCMLISAKSAISKVYFLQVPPLPFPTTVS